MPPCRPLVESRDCRSLRFVHAPVAPAPPFCAKKKFKMNNRLVEVYKTNERLLKSIIGTKILLAERELYYYENKLVKESMGELRLTFSNNTSIIFTCDLDAESLNLYAGNFSNKEKMMKDFETTYRWEVVTYHQLNPSLDLGEIKSFSILESQHKQRMVTIRFSNECAFYFEITCSDCVNYFVLRKR